MCNNTMEVLTAGRAAGTATSATSPKSSRVLRGAHSARRKSPSLPPSPAQDTPLATARGSATASKGSTAARLGTSTGTSTSTSTSGRGRATGSTGSTGKAKGRAQGKVKARVGSHPRGTVRAATVRNPPSKVARAKPAKSTTGPAGAAGAAKPAKARKALTKASGPTNAAKATKLAAPTCQAAAKVDCTNWVRVQAALEAGQAAMLTPLSETAALCAALDECVRIDSLVLPAHPQTTFARSKEALDAQRPQWEAALATRSLVHPVGSEVGSAGAGAGTGATAVWQVDSTRVKEAIEMAVKVAHRTPLVLDNTSSKVVRSYLKYTSTVPLNMKKVVMQHALKQTTLGEAQEEMRVQLVTAMTAGYPLHVDLMNTAPDFAGKFFSDSAFPRETLVTEAVQGFDGKVEGEYYSTPVNTPVAHKKLAAAGEWRELQHAGLTGRSSGMHVIITSDFELEDYQEFLAPCLPDLGKFQVICVTNANDR